jgi:hypothetical protein
VGKALYSNEGKLCSMRGENAMKNLRIYVTTCSHENVFNMTLPFT